MLTFTKKREFVQTHSNSNKARLMPSITSTLNVCITESIIIHPYIFESWISGTPIDRLLQRYLRRYYVSEQHREFYRPLLESEIATQYRLFNQMKSYLERKSNYFFYCYKK